MDEYEGLWVYRRRRRRRPERAGALPRPGETREQWSARLEESSRRAAGRVLRRLLHPKPDPGR